MDQHYSLTRTTFARDDDPGHTTTMSVGDTDPVHCARLIAAGFNEMNGDALHGFKLAVVGPASEAADAILDDLYEVLRTRDVEIAELRQERVNNAETQLGMVGLYAMIHNRDEENAELRQELAQTKEKDRLGGVLYRDAKTAEARAEMLKHVKDAHKGMYDIYCPSGSEDRYEGMRDVLARFLVAIGETTEDGAHAYVDRLIAEDDN